MFGVRLRLAMEPVSRQEFDSRHGHTVMQSLKITEAC